MATSQPHRSPASPSRPGILLGRRTALAASVGIAVLSVWSAASTWYIAARDDIAQRVFASEAETAYGYQDRIKLLQDQLEREVTRNLVERDGVAGRIERLATRQADIEARQAVLARIAERSAPTEVATAPAATAGAALTNGRPRPPAEPFALRMGGNGNSDGRVTSAPPRDRVSMIEQSLDGVDAAGFRLVDALKRDLDERTARLRTALGGTGLDMDRILPSAGIGGPLVALPSEPATSGGFGPLAAALDAGYGDYERLLGAARRLPIGRPVVGELDQTSPFGYRYDPFTRTPALHTGVDLRAEWGSPVRATAGGRVSVAEATGGYGNMVEIDHGGGLVTRYGHLSAFLVSPADRVEAGQMIARAGSTGRSTGSHLHYETRINGEAVDPTRFLAAGSQLAALSDRK